MTDTYEIRLIIDRAESGYSAKWVDSGGQESNPFALTLPLAQADADLLRWYLEEYIQLPGAGDHARARGVEEKLKGRFEGSIPWYFVTVKLDLEARGEIRRVPKSKPQMIEMV